MLEKKAIIILAVSIISVAAGLWFFLLPRESGDSPPSEPESETNTVADLGITYIRVSPMLSACYDLGLDYGVLVTEVVPGSPMDLASVQAGDVILSYNGAKLDEGCSLLGMMRACRPDDRIVLEVCRNKSCHIVEFCACCGTPYCNCEGPVSKDKNEYKTEDQPN